MHHTRQAPPSFVQTGCDCVSVCVCELVLCQPPAPWHSPIALSRGILNAAHNRPISCHSDSLTERKKKRGRVRFSVALTEGGEMINLGETSLTSVAVLSPQSFSLKLVLFCHFEIKKVSSENNGGPLWIY